MGGTFRVVWLRRFDLPFGATEHLSNPLNEGKPVKICRDGQELPPDVGEALVALIEDGADAAGVPRPSRPAGAALACRPCGTVSFCVFKSLLCSSVPSVQSQSCMCMRISSHHCCMTAPSALAGLIWDL